MPALIAQIVLIPGILLLGFLADRDLRRRGVDKWWVPALIVLVLPIGLIEWWLARQGHPKLAPGPR